MLQGGPDLLARPPLPQPRGLVAAAGEYPALVFAKDRAIHGSGMLQSGTDLLASAHIPQPRMATVAACISAPGEDPALVFAKDCTPDESACSRAGPICWPVRTSLNRGPIVAPC